MPKCKVIDSSFYLFILNNTVDFSNITDLRGKEGRGTPNGTQGLFLAQCSGLFLVGARDQIQASCMEGQTLFSPQV